MWNISFKSAVNLKEKVLKQKLQASQLLSNLWYTHILSNESKMQGGLY
jgi:hypothetical protein